MSVPGHLIGGMIIRNYEELPNQYLRLISADVPKGTRLLKVVYDDIQDNYRFLLENEAWPEHDWSKGALPPEIEFKEHVYELQYARKHS